MMRDSHRKEKTLEKVRREDKKSNKTLDLINRINQADRCTEKKRDGRIRCVVMVTVYKDG